MTGREQKRVEAGPLGSGHTLGSVTLGPAWSAGPIIAVTRVVSGSQQPRASLSETEGSVKTSRMREIVHIQIGQCGNQIGAKVRKVRGLAFLWSLGVANSENTLSQQGRQQGQQIACTC